MTIGLLSREVNCTPNLRACALPIALSTSSLLQSPLSFHASGRSPVDSVWRISAIKSGSVFSRSHTRSSTRAARIGPENEGVRTSHENGKQDRADRRRRRGGRARRLGARRAGTGTYWAYVRIPSTAQRRKWPPQWLFNSLLADCHRSAEWHTLLPLSTWRKPAVPKTTPIPGCAPYVASR